MHDDHHHHHQFRYNEEERLKRQDPVKILKSSGLMAGMTFIDLGSNAGFFTLPAAKIVGPNGQVYAVDVDEQAIETLNQKLAALGTTKFGTVVGKAEDTVFGAGLADFVFLGTVLHDFADPLQVLKNAKTMLKSSGKLVNLDWRKKETVIGPPLDIRFSKAKSKELIEAAGMHVTSLKNYDNNYYLIEAVPEDGPVGH